jgi:hypothetical protein
MQMLLESNTNDTWKDGVQRQNYSNKGVNG